MSWSVQTETWPAGQERGLSVSSWLSLDPIWGVVSSLGSPVQTVMDLLEQLQTRAPKLNTRMHHPCHGERLRDLSFFRQEKSRLWGDLIAAFQYVKGMDKEVGERHYIKACSDWTRSNTF